MAVATLPADKYRNAIELLRDAVQDLARFDADHLGVVEEAHFHLQGALAIFEAYGPVVPPEGRAA